MCIPNLSKYWKRITNINWGNVKRDISLIPSMFTLLAVFVPLAIILSIIKSEFDILWQLGIVSLSIFGFTLAGIKFNFKGNKKEHHIRKELTSIATNLLGVSIGFFLLFATLTTLSGIDPETLADNDNCEYLGVNLEKIKVCSLSKSYLLPGMIGILFFYITIGFPRNTARLYILLKKFRNAL